MTAPVPVVVFADVDQTFSGGPTSPPPEDGAVAFAREHIALVLCSSMTRAEIEVSQRELSIRQPFICESGAAILIPHEYFPFDVPCDRDLTGYHVIEFGRPYSEVVALLHRASARLGIPVMGFSDLSVEQVARECGWSLAQARLAKLREYDEPFRLASHEPEAHRRLWRALRAARLVRTHQALYEHVGASVNKGTSVGILTSLYRRAFGAVITIGLGHASHSVAILRRVAWPVIVDSAGADQAQPMPRMPRLRVGTDRGAWIASILDVARQAREQSRPRASAIG